MKSGWKYGVLSDALEKESSNLSIKKLKNDNGNYPVFGASGLIKKVSFYDQDSDYISVIKDGAGIGKVSCHPAKSSVIATMQYLLPKDGFDLNFLAYYLEFVDLKKYRSGSTIPHIYYKDYKDEPLPLVPLSEQKQIVSMLDGAFRGIEKAMLYTQRNIENIGEFLDVQLHRIFTKDRKGQKNTFLSEIANFKNGLNFTRNSTGEKVKIVGVKDFQSNFHVPIDELDIVEIDGELRDNYILEKHDILTVRSNGNKQLIGRCIYLDEDIEILSFSGFTIRIRVVSPEVDPLYLAHYLQSNSVHQMLVESGGGTNIKSLNQQDLSSLPVTFPRKADQMRIVNVVEDLKASVIKIDSLYKNKLGALNNLKQSILEKAFSGELTNSS